MENIKIVGYADPNEILEKKRALWLEELHEFQACKTLEDYKSHFEKWSEIEM